MTWLETEVRRKLEAITQTILLGNALDYTAYASAVARYRVLKELLDDLAEQRKNASTGDEETND